MHVGIENVTDQLRVFFAERVRRGSLEQFFQLLGIHFDDLWLLARHDENA